MLRKLILLSAMTLIFTMTACTGSKSGNEAPTFSDQTVQSQVDDLLDKIDDNPSNSEYRLQLAQIYHENGQSLEALKLLEEGLALDPNDVELKFKYGEIAEEKGDMRRAFTAYKEVLQSASGNDYLDRIAPKFTDAFVVTPLVNSPANEAFGSFNGDGSKIIYQADPDGNWDLFEYTLGDTASTRLTQTPYHEENPAFNPNGEEIVYTSTEEDTRDVEYSQLVRDIYLWNLTKNRKTNLTQNSSDDWLPRYSENGQVISFISERDDLSEARFDQLLSEVYVMENDGRFQHRVTHNDSEDGGAVVAPGSDKDQGTLYYDNNASGVFEIYKNDYTGKNERQITFNPSANDLSPDISANGDKIVFFSDRDGNYELYLMNSDGSVPVRLTSNPGNDLNPVFSPDGTKILFHSNRAGNYDLYLMDLSRQNTGAVLYDVLNSIDQALNALNK
ncbi:MAG TPA: tetratricopeptide repeat protein [Caldithrix abyssi]|uniref:Tetratricopeptide repeat protein n=1 Tax=Caldithrix abyssi TaxID=187145 RepID=A0A7V1LN50_CALAY|nr:tetratricopeptide repeat protein [Caldithrix abyssi]